MVIKKFAQMTTKKLNALMAIASDEDKKAIEAVLAARKQAQALKATEETAEAPAEALAAEENLLTPEEEAAIEVAEENGGLNPLYNGSKATQEKKPKMTDEERHTLAEELKRNINHRCQAVPFNTVEWVDGYIVGVIEEKRSNKVLYAIKTDNGRRIVKVYDSNLVRIFDEMVELEKRVCTRKAKDCNTEKVEWTPEAIAAAVNEVIGNVGKTVKFERYRTTDLETGEEKIEYNEGRIAAIVPDKRTQRLLYRISVPAPIEGNPLATKIIHKIVTADLEIAEEFDAEGEELNKKYCERRKAAIIRTLLTPQDRFVKCEEALKKAEEKLQKATKELEAKKQQLEDVRKELDEWLVGQGASSAEAPAEEAEAPAEEADPLA